MAYTSNLHRVDQDKGTPEQVVEIIIKICAIAVIIE